MLKGGEIIPELAHGHETNIEHREAETEDEVKMLYINLKKLPAGTPVLKFDNNFRERIIDGRPGYDIPVFIIMPFLMLKRKICTEDFVNRPKNFLESFKGLYRDKPVPPADGCFVCAAVKYLVYECKSPKEALKYLLPLQQSRIFAIIREILRRLKPKILSTSIRHHRIHIRFNYLEMVAEDYGFLFPLESEKREPGSISYEIRRVYADEWNNGILFMLRRDISDCKAPTEVACFVWTNLIECLRCSLLKHLPAHIVANIGARTVFVDAIHEGYTVVKEYIEKLAVAIAGTALDFRCDPETRITYREKIENELIQACENFLTSNNLKFFMASVDVEDGIVHFNDHAKDPSTCLCRFYEHLKRNKLQYIQRK